MPTAPLTHTLLAVAIIAATLTITAGILVGSALTTEI